MPDRDAAQERSPYIGGCQVSIRPIKMSARLRLELEILSGQLRSDAPLCSSEGAQRLKDILGYWTDENGNRIDENGDRIE